MKMRINKSSDNEVFLKKHKFLFSRVFWNSVQKKVHKISTNYADSC